MNIENGTLLPGEDIIQLLKRGRAHEIEAFIREQRLHQYPNQFPVFMAQMIEEHKVKRKEIALRSGMSQDYVYKLLRGDKHTDERDYILAICMAIGMNLAQTQHALACYGMRILNMKDLRDYLISHAIKEGVDIDGLNEMLEKMEYELLKTSPDMPTAKTYLFEGADDGQSEDERAAMLGDLLAEDGCKQVYCNTYAEHCGEAPFDFAYWGEICIELQNGERYVLQSMYHPEYEAMVVMTEAEKLAADEKRANGDAEAVPAFVESYPSFIDARRSRYFKYFMIIDQAVDRKVNETLREVDDTRYWNGGIRIGGGYADAKGRRYIECFNTRDPSQREYLQIVEVEGEAPVYSVSHESCYMRIEMGDIYEIYFGSREAPEYFIRTTDLTELTGRDVKYRFVFNELQMMLHQAMGDKIHQMGVPQEQMEDENLSVMIQRAVMLHHAGEDEESLKLLLQALEILTADTADARKNFVTLACTYVKIGFTLQEMGRTDEARKYWEALYAMKERMPDDLSEEERTNVNGCIANALIFFRRHAMTAGDTAGEIRWLKEQIDLTDGTCSNEQEWVQLFEACGKYAFALDASDPTAAERYYLKAFEIAMDQGLLQNPACRMAIPVLYNNYAWVLWNRLGSEEAIIYYGIAIDLTESIARTEDAEREATESMLEDYAGALHEIYVQTGKKREAERLQKRMEKIGVTL